MKHWAGRYGCLVAIAGLLMSVACQADAADSAGKAPRPGVQTDSGEPAHWTRFVSPYEEFVFEYPADILVLFQDSSGTALIHSLPRVYPDPCDFRDHPDTLTAFTDFDLLLTVLSAGLRDAVRRFESADILARFRHPAEVDTVTGFIDRVAVGNRYGYRVTHGVEGCGYYRYFLPLDATHTLVARRRIIFEVSGNCTVAGRFLALPGAIPPDREEAFVRRILASVQLSE